MMQIEGRLFRVQLSGMIGPRGRCVRVVQIHVPLARRSRAKREGALFSYQGRHSQDGSNM